MTLFGADGDPSSTGSGFRDPERALALAYAPGGRRDALATLWRLDARLETIAFTSTEPMIRAIKLAWWREAIEALDATPAPAEPLLREIGDRIVPALVPGMELAGLEQGWALLGAFGDGDMDAAEEGAMLRGGQLFGIAARLLGAGDVPVRQAGEGWALIDLAGKVRDPALRARFTGAAAARLDDLHGRKWPRRLRALGVLTVLAARSARAAGPERAGSPARVARAMMMGFTGR